MLSTATDFSTKFCTQFPHLLTARKIRFAA
jgi:hypothetical protein